MDALYNKSAPEARRSTYMLFNLILIILGLAASLLTYFLTPLFAMHWAYAFLILPMWLGYWIAILGVITVTFTFVCYLISLSKKEVEKPSKFAYWCCSGIIYWLFGFLWIKTTITGKELIPKDTRFLMVSNHISMFDFLIVFAKLGSYQIVPITKKETFDYPWAGPVAKASGFIPIDRENPAKGLRAILKAIRLIKNDLSSIFIAPEGTRSLGGRMNPFHAGSFKIAEKSKCPIVVACVSGTDAIHKNFFRRVSHVRLDILEVLSSEEVSNMTTLAMADHCQQLIQDYLDGLEENATTKE